MVGMFFLGFIFGMVSVFLAAIAKDDQNNE
jgi:hypothetical protein